MGKLENNCLVLLMYLSENPEAKQDYRSLEEATGIPHTTIRDIIYYPWLCAADSRPYVFTYWALEKYADKYGFEFRVLHKTKDRRLSVVKRKT